MSKRPRTVSAFSYGSYMQRTKLEARGFKPGVMRVASVIVELRDGGLIPALCYYPDGPTAHRTAGGGVCRECTRPADRGGSSRPRL